MNSSGEVLREYRGRGGGGGGNLSAVSGVAGGEGGISAEVELVEL